MRHALAGAVVVLAVALCGRAGAQGDSAAGTPMPPVISVPEPTPQTSPAPDAGMPMAPEASPAEPQPAAPAPVDHAAMHHHHHMPSVLGLSHGREASGTSWQPDETPVYGDHLMLGGFSVMAHYMVFGVFAQMYGPRGKSDVFSTNWGMAMVSHELGGGVISGRAMLSLEPLTVPRSGYPLLLQTGETYQGAPLHDVQHPHDLFMELSLGYARELFHGVAGQLYLAPVGEPALGPTAYSHRESASFSPLAPLTHHHLDSTHISFGVVTAALYTRQLKVEGSVFNGHEPNEERWGFDPIALNSWSARLSWAPCPGFVAQASYGHLSQPEAQNPGEDENRFTLSTTLDHRFGEGNVATTLAWGYKKSGGIGSHGLLAETTLDADGNDNVFARFEWVQRTPEDLAVSPALGETLPVGEATVGYMYQTDPIGDVRAGLGIQGYLAFVPTSLESTYGGSAEPGLAILLRLRPGARQ